MRIIHDINKREIPFSSATISSFLLLHNWVRKTYVWSAQYSNSISLIHPFNKKNQDFSHSTWRERWERENILFISTFPLFWCLFHIHLSFNMVVLLKRTWSRANIFFKSLTGTAKSFKKANLLTNYEYSKFELQFQERKNWKDQNCITESIKI